MLQELKDPERLRGLLAENPPVTAMVHYNLFIQKPDPDSPFQLILVDDPDDPSCALLMGWGNMFISRDPAKFELALDYMNSKAHLDLIEKTFADNAELREHFLNTYRFAGLEQCYCERLLKEGEPEYQTRCWVYYWDSSPPREPKVPLSPLKPEHAHMVEAHWEFGDHDDDTVGYIRWRIEAAPTLAFYDEKGEPGAWCIIHGGGSMGNIYTRRAYRRQGLAMEITYGMVRAILEGGWLPHAHIKQQNQPSLKLAERAGLKRGDDVSWISVRRKKSLGT